MILLIDGDILLFKVLYLYQAIRAGKEGISKKLLTNCLLQVMDQYSKKFEPTKIVIMCKLFPCKYFRHNINSEYKSNRNPTPPEILVLREILQTLDLALYSSDFIETDDLLSLYMTETSDTDYLVCLSGDKDLLQIPGVHASFYHDKIRLVTEKGEYALDRKTKPIHPNLYTTGFIHFCKQMISGDKIDNIKGLKGLGPVKIYDYLETWNVDNLEMHLILLKIKELYDTYGSHNIQTFNENKNLLWILRKMCDYTSESLELIIPENELQNKIIKDNLTFRDFLNYAKD